MDIHSPWSIMEPNDPLRCHLEERERHDLPILIDADFGYEKGEIAAKIRLEKGRHPIAIHLLKSGESAPMLEVDWSGPSFERKALATESLVH